VVVIFQGHSSQKVVADAEKRNEGTLIGNAIGTTRENDITIRINFGISLFCK
jgi:hypothetical protein